MTTARASTRRARATRAVARATNARGTGVGTARRGRPRKEIARGDADGVRELLATIEVRFPVVVASGGEGATPGGGGTRATTRGDDANASASANANARARRAAAATTYDDDDDDEVSSSEDEGRDGRLSYAPRYNPNRARGRVQTKEELDAAAPKRAHDLGRRGVDGGVTFEDDGVDLSVLTSRLLTREECEEVRRVESVSSPSAPRARLDLSILHVIEHSRFLTNRIPPRRRISTRCGPRTRSGRSSCRCFRRVLYTGPHTTPSAW